MIELLVVMAILAVLTFLGFPAYNDLKDKARGAKAITDIREMEKTVIAYAIDKGGVYPNDLSNLPIPNPNDPWGTPYVYTSVANPGSHALRLDYLGEPLNTDFDLYSSGPDGQSPAAIADPSRQGLDDIVRAGDGGFVGHAQELAPL